MNQPSSTDSDWQVVGEVKSLAKSGRLHACLKGRYVSVLLIKGSLTCIDSICFHAGGPLALGDIEDVDGKPCLVCPWHDYKIDAFSGEKYYQAVTWQDGKMIPSGWKSNGPRHRMHAVEERSDGLVYVQLNTDAGELPSDEYAFNTTCGGRVLSSPNTAAGRSSATVGADGKLKRPAGLRSPVRHATGVISLWFSSDAVDELVAVAGSSSIDQQQLQLAQVLSRL